MTTHPEIRAALAEKIPVRQSLAGRVSRLKRRAPMTTEDAHYVIAFSEGINIGRYLDPDTLERVDRLRHAVSNEQVTAPQRRAPASRPRRTTEVRIAGVKIESVPGMTAKHAREAKRMAEKVYPMLYVFENSARDVIDGVLTRDVGRDWWDQIASTDMKKDAEKRKADEEKDAWHDPRGAHSIHYLDLARLPDIVRHKRAWPHFKAIFGKQTWFDGLVADLNVSRRVIAHMNAISADDVQHMESSFKKWVKQLRAKKDLLP